MFRVQYVIAIGLFLNEMSLICEESKKELPAPQSVQSMETAVRSVQAVLPEKNHLKVLGVDSPLLFVSPYKGEALEREKKFGSLLEVTKMPIGKKTDRASWVDIGQQDNLHLVLDGQSLIMVAYGEAGQEVARRSVIWDLIRPAHDAVGEAATWETQELRAEVKAKMKKISGKKLVGMVALPDSWRKDKKRTWLVSSTLPNLPILLMECEDLESTQCQLARTCPLSFGEEVIEVGGIGVDEKRHHILLVDRTHNALQVIRYRSCSDLSRVSTLFFPDRIKNVTNVKMDENANTWVTVAEPDPYTNGSVFYYTENEIAPFLK